MPAFRLPHPGSEDHPHLSAAVHVFWAGCGIVVVLFIFFAALGTIEPRDAVELTIVVVALAALWLAHEWRELWRAERR